MNMQARPPIENMLMSRREAPGTGAGGAQALVNQMGQKPNMALPNSTPQSGMPQMPNSQQLVTGKDGKKYQVVIDPKVGLQTFIPYREPQRVRQCLKEWPKVCRRECRKECSVLVCSKVSHKAAR